jgi:hypothetical protein
MGASKEQLFREEEAAELKREAADDLYDCLKEIVDLAFTFNIVVTGPASGRDYPLLQTSQGLRAMRLLDKIDSK